MASLKKQKAAFIDCKQLISKMSVVLLDGRAGAASGVTPISSGAAGSTNIVLKLLGLQR